MRLNNPDSEDTHQETRVQNEVAILSLARDTPSHINLPVVPRVLGWGSASRNHTGWILQELMPVIQKQRALFLKALQDYQLPESIHNFGGAYFDSNSAMVSGPMKTAGAGPWDSLEKSCRECLKAALAKTDKNLYIRTGKKTVFESVLMPSLRMDFPENLLYDPATYRVTALLDYDFANILHPAHEFFQSFGTSGGQFLGWSRDKEAEVLRTSQLTGLFPSPLPSPVAPKKWFRH
ncbi:hypothetical protein ABEW05_004469 [Botrytis cinerea]